MQDARGPSDIEPMKENEAPATLRIPEAGEVLADAGAKAIEGADTPGQSQEIREKKDAGSAWLAIFPNFIHFFVAGKWGLGTLFNQ